MQRTPLLAMVRRVCVGGLQQLSLTSTGHEVSVSSRISFDGHHCWHVNRPQPWLIRA